MRAYLLVTGILFALLVVAHVWRVTVEGTHLATQPFFIFTTIAAAALCLWSVRLIRSAPRR